MKRSLFIFDLPEELIAQRPTRERDGARLLVVNAKSGELCHSDIKRLPEWVPDETLCVPNDVKVRHARLRLLRSGGGKGEALLLKSLGNGRFEAIVRPGAKLRQGKIASVTDPHNNTILATLTIETELGEGLRIIQLSGNNFFDWEAVDAIGRLPLPPYIHRPACAEDDDRYQTTFHSNEGEAVAAPTAGLHFTPELISMLEQKGCLWRPLRLHVGLGTFRPMTATDIEDHAMHEESFEIPDETALELKDVLLGRSRDLLAIGTTSLRAIESAWNGTSLKQYGSTKLFIYPGHKTNTADHLLTNFHLPESTLFALVCALLGIELAQRAYKTAIQEKYRFFSYGDAMLIKNIRPKIGY
ncbi:MAG: tRNA preQ1(34) S-adenosylmethionine ribosyltransferase-isomerase QueA [Holophagaceae bacterium]|nr:tRNA preQ1(34) S-adenosylmethionine ribosyltransferase-isomerase QueA [Holophagaceae bacterium]